MHVTWPPRNRRITAVDGLGLTGLLGLLVARFIPVAKIIPFWGCAFRQLTGWPCPGCGLTRAADRFAHLHFAWAWEANPLGTIGAGVFALLAVYSFLHLVFGVPVPKVELSRREERVLQVLTVVAVILNYGFVIMKTRFPHGL